MNSADVLLISGIVIICIVFSALSAVADARENSMAPGNNSTCTNTSNCTNQSGYTPEFENIEYPVNQTNPENGTVDSDDIIGDGTEIMESLGKIEDFDPVDPEITPQQTLEPKKPASKKSSSGYDFMAMSEQNQALAQKNRENALSQLSGRGGTGINVFDAPRPIIISGGCGG